MRYKLGEIFNLQMGKTPDRHSPKFWNEGTEPWISIADLTKCNKYIENTAEKITATAADESGIKIIPKNTVIMSFKLSIGKVAITPKEMYSNEAIMSFIDKGVLKIEPVYLYYLLMHKDWDTGTNKAVMGKTLNKASLSQMTVNIHGYSEQLEIIKALDAASSIIAARKQQLTELDNLIKARFVEMFGDPISNPKGWKKDKAESHIDLLSGYPFQSEQYVNDGINICGGLIIMPQKIQWQDCRHWPSVDGYEDYLLAEDDIVMALDRPWISEGFKIAQVDSTHLPALLIQRTARIRGIDVNQQYLFHCFVNGGFDKHSNVTGSLVPHISAKDIRSFEILLPPIKLQKQFAAFVKQVDKSKVVEAIYKTNTLFNITLNGGNRYDIRANEF